MKSAITKNWWSLVIRGLFGITLGIITFLWPAITLTGLVFLFGGFALLDGIMSIAGAVSAVQRHERWGALVFEGFMGIAAAAITVLWPGITALGLVLLVAAWSILGGAARIAAAIRLRREITGEWLLILSGIASLVFGVLIAIMPLAGAFVIAIWVGAYAFLVGILLVVLGLRLRSLHRDLLEGPTVPYPAH
jgi:uncharacterized membrane protein HdeD (DUF308 family)